MLWYNFEVSRKFVMVAVNDKHDQFLAYRTGGVQLATDQKQAL